MTDHGTDLLTEAEVATLLRKQPRVVAKLRKAGKLAYLPGRPVLIPRTSLNRYLAQAIVTDNPVAPAVRLVRTTQ